MSPALASLASVIVVSLVSFVGVALFLWDERVIRRVTLYLVSFSTGAILGDVFLHMLPEILEESGRESFSLALRSVLVGVVLSFALEKLIRWRHCHHFPLHDHDHDHCHAAGLMTLLGDGVHNFIDGVIIAVSFLAGPQIGITSTLAVIFHEIPQEVGNFAVLLHDGYSRGRALFFNFLSALMALFGVLVVVIAEFPAAYLPIALLPFAAGNFLYIAGADLIPELHRESGFRQALLQLLSMVAGIGVMWLLLGVE